MPSGAWGPAPPVNGGVGRGGESVSSSPQSLLGRPCLQRVRGGVCGGIPVASCLSLVWDPDASLLHPYTSLLRDPWLAFLPPPDPSPPTTRPPLGQLEEEGTVGFVSPVFHTGDGWPHLPDQVPPALRGRSYREAPHPPVPLLSGRELWDQTASRSYPLFPFPGWICPWISRRYLRAHPRGVPNSRAYCVPVGDLVASCGPWFPAFTQLQPTTRWREQAFGVSVLIFFPPKRNLESLIKSSGF